MNSVSPLFYRVRNRMWRGWSRLAHPVIMAVDSRSRPRGLADPGDTHRAWEAFGALAPCGMAAGQILQSQLPSEQRDKLRKKADAICAHEFDLLGSGPVTLGENINWHQDFKSGYTWDKTLHFSRIPIYVDHLGADIKVPWELSRCQHFATLGMAYQVTGDEKYIKEFVGQVEHWIAHNPPERGVNWVCSMDVAIRAVNWLMGFWLFQGPLLAEKRYQGLLQRMGVSLWQHGLHIRRNLEWQGSCSPKRGNHFVADLVGLLTVGTLFSKEKRARKWRCFARSQLEREILFQVLDDGTSFEGSISYHRLLLECFHYSAELCDRSGQPMSSGYKDRLRLMRRFVAAYLKPDGRAPLIGDNDDGRFLQSGLLEMDDHRYLASEEGLDAEESTCEQLLFGAIPRTKERLSGPHDFPHGGFFFVKDVNNYLAIRAGRLANEGWHGHCDQLSFVLHVHGSDVVVDRGSFVYSADMDKRNSYRASASHNTLVIDGHEQNRFSLDAAGLFCMQNNTHTRIRSWTKRDDGAELLAEHYGYQRLEGGYVHSRKLDFQTRERRLVIEDRVQPWREELLCDWYFQLAPDVTAKAEADRVLMEVGGREVKLTFDPSLRVSIERVGHSPSYGIEVEASRLHFTTTGIEDVHDDNHSFVFTFFWG